MSRVEQVSALMTAFRAGEREAGAKLIELFYPELKRLAASHLKRERDGHSWQPTLLVNELYLALSKIKELRSTGTEYHDDKAAFFALSGLLMRRLLIQHARKASSHSEKIPIDNLPTWEELRSQPEGDLAEVELLLQQLEEVDPVVRTVVEMKVFEGCTAEQIAHRLGCSKVSVYRNWQFGRHWLQTKL